MPGRVLNFNEFSDKYSSGSNEPSNIDDIKNASSNFEEGFDDDTYDQPQIGPNRPVSGNYETTPASPGEEGSPAFSSQNTQEMNAPEEMESDEPENEESEEEESEEEEDDVEEAVGDKSYTSKGGTVTQTATGLTHQAGSGVYGGTETDSEEEARK